MLSMFLRIVVFFVLLNVGMRLMGKRQVGEIQLAEFISAIMLSELALLPITDPNKPLIYGVLGIVVLCCLEVINAYLCRKSAFFRHAVEGRPLVLLSHGKIDDANLDRCRISTEELFTAIRGAGYRGPEEINYVILEQNGTLSVIPKAAAQPLTPGDTGAQVVERGISHPLVIDGKVQQRTLGQTGKDRRWLNKQLAEKGLDLKELLYFCIDDADGISYERKKK